MRLSDTAEYAKGLIGEQLVRDSWLRDGYYLVDTRDFKSAADRAPRLNGSHDNPIMPDFLVFKTGTAMWAEVKTKQAPNFFRNMDRDEHGFDARLADQYRLAQQISGIPVWIVVHELSTGALLCGRFDALMARCRLYDGGAYRAMVNFGRADFSEIDPALPGSWDRAFCLGAALSVAKPIQAGLFA